MIEATPSNLIEEVRKIGDYKVFKHFFPSYEPGSGSVSSPLRTDHCPSFSIKQFGDKWRYRDFANGSNGDSIEFVMELEGLGFHQALLKIYEELQDNNTVVSGEIAANSRGKTKKRQDKPVVFGMKSKPFTPNELQWWDNQGISLHTLQRYNVYSCEYIFINNHPIFCRVPTYAYVEFKSGTSYKFYCPEGSKEDKWFNNQKDDVWQGWEQMKFSDTLIWTKSRKDVMAIDENTEFSSVSLQAESILPKPQVVAELQKRFKYIYLLYDGDKQGRLMSAKLNKLYGFPIIEIPEYTLSKDYSDLTKSQGREKASEILRQLISQKN